MAARIDASTKSLSRTTNIPPITAFTVMGWCRREVDRNAVSSFGFLRSATGGGNSVSGVQTSAAGDALGVWVDSLSSTFHTMTNAEWFFVGWKCNGTTVTGFARTEAAGSLTEASIADNDTSAALICFGDRFVNGGEWMNCSLANIKIYDAHLTTQECYDESLQQSPLRTANLNSWFLLNSAQTINDQSGAARHLTNNGTVTFNNDMPNIPLTNDPVYELVSYRWLTNTGTGTGEPA